MQISVEQYLKEKNEDSLEGFEVSVLREFCTTADCVISNKMLKRLYIEALSNVNKDAKFLKTALTIERITKGSEVFKKIRAMVGSPVRRYWGMHKLKSM